MSHAPFPPSSAYRWLRCPQAAHYDQWLPAPPPGQAALTGTDMHAKAEQHLRAGDDSSCPRLQMYLDTVRALEGERFIEHKVIIEPELCWGTVDCLVVGAPVHVVDLKWGKHPVSVRRNPQLMLYALGAHALERASSYSLVIVQPNAASGWPVKRWTVSEKQLLAFRDQVLRAIDRALRDRPLVLAGDHCHWCLGRHLCLEAYQV